MALGGSRPYRSLCRNLPPIDNIEDELARDPGPAKSSHLGNTSPVLSCNPTPGPALVLALIFAPVSILAPALPSSNELFRKFIKSYLESNQGLKQPLAERKQFFKAKVSDVYYKKSYIDCYHFCQQCKDYFETVRATRTNQILFAAFFLCGSINVQWTQYKHYHWSEKPTPIT